jgi:hypothetical protein
MAGSEPSQPLSESPMMILQLEDMLLVIHMQNIYPAWY